MSAAKLVQRSSGSRLPALLGIVLLGAGAGLGACGGSQPRGGPVAGAAARATTSGEPPPTATTTTTTTSMIPPGQTVMGDGDADNPSDIDGNGDSDSARVGGPDNDNDSPTRESYRFPDSDDGPSFAYGHRPSVATARALTSIVRRYYTAASVSDGAVACALLGSGLARSIPESYAGPLAPAYLRGAKTCQATLARFFGHYHKELAAPVEVFAVRVEGETARAIFSSRTLPASGIFLMRQGRSWRLSEVLGHPLP